MLWFTYQLDLQNGINSYWYLCVRFYNNIYLGMDASALKFKWFWFYRMVIYEIALLLLAAEYICIDVDYKMVRVYDCRRERI